MVSNDFMGIGISVGSLVWQKTEMIQRNFSRVRVRCFGYHDDDLDKIPTEDLPCSSFKTHRYTLNGWVTPSLSC